MRERVEVFTTVIPSPAPSLPAQDLLSAVLVDIVVTGAVYPSVPLATSCPEVAVALKPTSFQADVPL